MVESTLYGKWIIDENGLPAFQYTCKEYSDLRAQYYTTYGGSTTHYHLIGNEAWSLLVTNHGHVIGLDPRRGFTLIGNDGWEPNPNHGGLGYCVIHGHEGKILTDLNTPEDEILDTRVFGSGYFQKSSNRNGITLKNTIYAPTGNNAIVISEVTIESTRTDPIDIEFSSCWDIYHYPLRKSAIVSSYGRKDYFINPLKNILTNLLVFFQRLFRMDTDGSRRKHARRIGYHQESTDAGQTILVPKYKSLRNRDPSKSSNINYHYKPIFLECLESDVKVEINYDQKKGCLVGKSSLTIQKSRPIKLILIFGVEDKQNIPKIISQYKNQIQENRAKAPFKTMISNFKRQSLSIYTQDMPWINREIQWHSNYLLSSMFTDDFYKYPRIPQGSIYLLGHGFDGSVRDYCLYLLPLIFLSPNLARENLKFIFSLVERTGKIPYSFHGYGKTVSIPGIHANPSDQYFFVIWALSEYIYLTRDYQILKELLSAANSTIADILKLIINYVLSEHIGLGEHDMVRVCDGDWNDGITFMVKKRRKFMKRGESTFNSAMLAYSFKKILPLIESLDRSLANLMKKVMNKVMKALNTSWNGKWFNRGWDGVGNPIGTDSLFLEHHVWLILNENFHGDQINTTVSNIWKNLVIPAQIGAHCLDPPSSQNSLLPNGWDINGGIWHVLNWLLLWSLRVHSPNLASKFLNYITMQTRAEKHPDIWYGIWSGPDSYNSNDSLRPGEAFFHVATPMCDFPFMNNNLHAGILAAVIKFAGIKGNYEGIVINLDIEHDFSLSSALISIDKNESEITIWFRHEFRADFVLNVILPQNFMVPSDIDIFPPLDSGIEMHQNQIKLVYTKKNPIDKILIKK